MPQLEGYSARGRKVFPLDGDQLTLGRGSDVAIRLDDDQNVSRLHALLERLPGGWRVSDLGSRNGTYVNDHRLTEAVALRPGDELRAGSWRLVFVDSAADADATFREGDDARALPAASAADLSERERQVLALVARGARDDEIAAELFIAVATVRSHLDRIRDKTGCRRRPELTRLAVEQGIVAPRRTVES